MTHYSKIKDKPETHLATHRLPTESDHPEEMPEPPRSPSLLPKSAMEGPSSPSSPSTPLEVLGLSAQPYNALMDSGITTVEQLAAMSHWELLDVPNIGYTLLEIWDKLKTYLAARPLSTQPESSVEGLKSPPPTKRIPSIKKPKAPQRSSSPPKPAPMQASPSSSSRTPLSVLNLSADLRAALIQSNVTTVEQLAEMSDSEIIQSVLHVGFYRYIETRSKVKAYLAFQSSSWTLIENLKLSGRSRSTLWSNGITTVEQLAVMSDREILDVPGIGRNSLAEIKDKLEDYLAVHPLSPRAGHSEGKLRPSPPAKAALRREESHPRPRPPARPKISPAHGPSSLISSAPLEAIGLSTRPYNALMRSGIDSVDRLAALSDQEILDIRNMGSSSLIEIRDRLGAYIAVRALPTETTPSEEEVKPPLSSALPETASTRAFLPLSSSTPLEALGLSFRSHNTLMRNDITTVEQLVTVSDSEILNIPGIGHNSLAEVKENLRVYLATHPLPTRVGRSEGKSKSSLSAQETLVIATEESASHQPPALQTETTPIHAPSPPPSTPLEVLGLSARSHNTLMRNDITTVEQLVTVSDSEILNIPGIGHNSLAEVKENLRVYLATHPLPTRVGRSEGKSKSSLSAQETLVIATEESASHQPPALQTETTPIRAPSPPPSTPLEVLGLSTRPRNALRQSNIDSVDQLAALSDQEILDIRNIGSSSLTEIRDGLGAYLAARALPTETTPPEEEVKPPLSSALSETALTRSFLPLSSSTPLETLGLSTRPHNALVRSGITTVKQLAAMSDREIQDLLYLDTYNTIVKSDVTTVEQLAAMPDWEISIGYSVLAEIKDKLRAYSAVHKWLSLLNERGRQIVEWRYGLDGEELTMEEVGERLDVTRARVQQLQVRALRVLRCPQCRAVIRPLSTLLVYLLEQAGGLMNEAQVEAALRQEMVIGNVNPIGVARLILELDANVKWLRKIRVWGLRSCPLGQLKNVQAQLSQVLQEELAPLPVHEVVTRFRSTSFYRDHSDELTDTFVVACLKVHPGIEVDDAGLYALTKWTGKSLPEIVRVLRELGEPAHYSKIAERINDGVSSVRRITSRHVQTQLTQNPEIFSWVGLRGTYGLKEWGVERALTYEEALTQIFEEAGHPLTYQQILARMPQFRPYYEEASLVLTLGTNGRFRSFPGDTYGLAEWQEEDFSEDYRLQRLFDEVEVVPSVNKPKAEVVEALDDVDGFIARARERTNDGR